MRITLMSLRSIWMLAAVAVGVAACQESGDPITVPVVEVTVVTAPPAQATVGTTLPEPITLRVTHDGAPAPGIEVEWMVTEGEGSLESADAVTDAEGHASAIWTLGSATGEQSLRVITAGSDPVDLTTMAVAAPAAAIEVVWDAGDTPRVVGSTTKEPVVVRVTDGFGNPVAGAEVEWLTLPGSGSFDRASSTTDAVGRTGAYWTFGLGGGVHTGRVTVDGEVVRDILVPTEKGERRYTVQEIPVPAGATLILRHLNSAGVAAGWLRWDDGTEAAGIWDGSSLQEVEERAPGHNRVLGLNEAGTLLVLRSQGGEGGSLWLDRPGEAAERLIPPEESEAQLQHGGALMNEAEDVYVPLHIPPGESRHRWGLFRNGGFESYTLNHDFPFFARFEAADFNSEGEVLGHSPFGSATPVNSALRVDDPEATPRPLGAAFSESRSLNDRGVVTIAKNSISRQPGSYPLIRFPDGRVVNLEVATTGIYPFAPLSTVSLTMALNNHDQVVIGRALPHSGIVGLADDPNVPYPTWYWEDGEGVFRLVLEGHPGMIRTMTAHSDSGEFLAVLVSPDGSEARPAIFTPVAD